MVELSPRNEYWIISALGMNFVHQGDGISAVQVAEYINSLTPVRSLYKYKGSPDETKNWKFEEISCDRSINLQKITASEIADLQEVKRWKPDQETQNQS
jgi:hypothetical protein